MVNYFLLIDQKYNVMKVPARMDESDLMDMLYERGKELERGMLQFRTRAELFAYIKEYLNDTRRKE